MTIHTNRFTHFNSSQLNALHLNPSFKKQLGVSALVLSLSMGVFSPAALANDELKPHRRLLPMMS